MSSAYLSFTAALAVWAWVEVTFLLGNVSGPQRAPCRGDAQSWGRVWLAVLEHWFMVIPLPFEALWKWGMKSRERVESV